MKLLVLASPDQQKEIGLPLPDYQSRITITDILPGIMDQYDAYFFLNQLPDSDLMNRINDKIIIINEVVRTLKETGYPAHVIRINGWPGFLKRKVWDVAGEITDEAVEAFHMLDRKIMRVKDQPGLVSARVIAVIINEAHQALAEKVCPREDIDMALKLGTHYPFGPFEWCEKIGTVNVHRLLAHMAESDSRYLPLF